MTFSIVARCKRTGMLGMGVTTAVPAVGALVPYGAARVGLIASQAKVNPLLGIDGLALLREGLPAARVIDRLRPTDPGWEWRQLGVVDDEGRSAAYTGTGCIDWKGHILGDGFTVQGNMLVSEQTLTEVVREFESSAHEELPERLIRALAAGQEAGGDKRGRQSAALRVYRQEEYSYVDLRVDEHIDPVAELLRVWRVAQNELMPFIEMLPTRDDALGFRDQEALNLARLPPAERASRRRTRDDAGR